MFKPEFTKNLDSNVTVRDGDQLVLTCTVKGDPEPQVTWTKNGKPLSSSEILSLKYKNGVSTLTINEVFPEDEGVFVCTATNSIGSASSQSTIKIKR